MRIEQGLCVAMFNSFCLSPSFFAFDPISAQIVEKSQK